MFSDIQFCHSVFLQESENIKKNPLTFCLFQPASSSAIYISIYVLCFLWSVRMVDWTDGFQPHLEDLEGETERGGRPRPLLDSPCSSLFWFLLLSLISAVCQLPSHITDAILSLFVSFAHFFPPPRLYILLQLIHIIILSSYLYLFLHSHPFFFFFYHFFSSFIPCNALSKGILTFKLNFVLCYICCKYAQILKL